MKRLALLLLIAIPALAQTPTLVQIVSTGRQTVGVGGTKPVIIVTLPNVVGNNNALIVGVECVDTLTPFTVTDNVGGSTGWVQAKTIDSNGGETEVWYKLGITNAPQTITFSTGTNLPGAGNPVCQMKVAEYYNVQTSGAIGPIGSIGSKTTPVNLTLSSAPTSGDLVWYWASDGTGVEASSTVTFTAGSNFTLTNANSDVGSAVEASTSTTSTTAGLTVTGTDAYNAVAITLHKASAGTAPAATGIRVIARQGELYNATTHTMQVPCVGGNLIVGLLTSPDITFTASTTSSPSNTWSAGTNASQSGGKAQIFYAQNATTSATMTISPVYSGTSAGENFVQVDCISGAAVSAHDTDHTSTGNQTTTGVASNATATLTTDSITPNSSNGLVYNVTTVLQRSMRNTTGSSSGVLMDCAVDTTNDDGNTTTASHLYEDDGRAHIYNSGVSTINFKYTYVTSFTGTGSGVQTWESVSSAFKTAPVGGIGKATVY